MVKLYPRVSVLLSTIAPIFMWGQNLVVNPGFEDYQKCPATFAGISALVDNIGQPTSSSGDYFNTCNGGDFGVPGNFKGEQSAVEGNGYVGLYYYTLNDYREYVQMNTDKTLREKYPYKISFKVSLAEASQLAVKNMSIILTNMEVQVPNRVVLTNSRLDIQEGLQFREVQLKADKSLAQTEGWVTLSAEFEAKGFENHILVGNFKTNENTPLLNTENTIASSDFAYYFVDDFMLEEQPRVNYETDKIYVLEQNPFEPKGYKLDKKAVASIRKIYRYLKENAELQLRITGYANNSATPEKDKFLSSLRARAVALYLKKLGIDDERIVWEGAGSTKNLGKTLKKGELKNSKVEFVMTEFEDQ